LRPLAGSPKREFGHRKRGEEEKYIEGKEAKMMRFKFLWAKAKYVALSR